MAKRVEYKVRQRVVHFVTRFEEDGPSASSSMVCEGPDWGGMIDVAKALAAAEGAVYIESDERGSDEPRQATEVVGRGRSGTEIPNGVGYVENGVYKPLLASNIKMKL